MKDLDKLDLCNHLMLNEGAYFFKKGDYIIDNKIVDGVFCNILKNVEYELITKICRKRIVLEEPIAALYSLLIFKFTTLPSFLDFNEEEMPKKLLETKLAYILIVEIENYIVIVKKNVSHITSFINNLTPIYADILSGILVEDTTLFQHIKLSNMNMNENAMRNKSYEAKSLENTMPMFGANHTVINAARFTNNDGLCAININTSRLSKFGEKKNLLNLLKWMYNLVIKFDTYIYKDSFFSRFAKPQSWSKLQNLLTPVSLLIDMFKLHSYIQNLQNKDIFIKNKDVERYDVVTSKYAKIVESGVKCYNLDKVNGQIYSKSGKRNIGVKKSKMGLKIVSCGNLFNSLYYCEDDGQYIKIIDLINKLGCFSIGFSDYFYIYMNKRLYRNASIQNDFNSILSILCPFEDISRVTSEKGNGYDDKSSYFESCSMFGVIERIIFSDADFLLCDDLGNEWADHLAIKGNKISYIHSKCNEGKIMLSASSFQEVIGQAVKNIGNMNPDDDAIKRKMETMKGKWNKTGINKCRIGTPDDYERLYKELRHNPNKIQEICLAVNYLSKSKLSEAFDKIKRNENFKQRNSVIQLVWLLSGFISTCKEADLNCRIFCRD